MDNSEIAIRVQNLSKVYPITQKDDNAKHPGGLWNKFSIGKKTKTEEFYALKDVSFEIKKGEAVGIIGRNGAGKSTLLKILSGITEPTDGRIEIYGTVASVLEVGMGFHPELTGRENIYLSGTMLGIPKKQIEAKFDEIVEFAGVEKFIDTAVKHYSSGMYVRLAFSVVTNIDADILLFDEVLSVGDLAFQMKCSKKIKELVEKKKTVLLVSHNMNDIQHLCKSVIYLKRGIVNQNGNIETVKDYFEQSYVDNNPINEEITEENNSKTNNNILNKEWNDIDSPGDDSIKLKRIYIQNMTNPDNDIFLTDDKIKICFAYEKKDDNSFFDFGIIVMSMNNMLIGCHTLHSDVEVTKKREHGQYVATAVFEKDFFNDTTIDIGCSISKNNQTIIFHELNILRIKFNLQIREHEVDYFKNISKFFGPLRPKIDWEIKSIL